jgi:voltage-gated potassium channel
MKLENLKPAYYSIALLIIMLLIGFTGYLRLEHLSPLNAFFMTVSTVTTAGFYAGHELSNEGKVFTAFLLIFSVAFFAFAATTLTKYIVSGVFRNYYKYSKVKKDIDKLDNHVIVVGYGRNGQQAIAELMHHKIPLVVIENRENKIKDIQQRNDLLYIEDDPSSDEVLIRAGIMRAKALISVLATDEENLFVVLTSYELNPMVNIISRAINFNTIKKLKSAGATHVIMPDKISGQHMARMIAQPNVIDFVEHLIIEKSKEGVLEEIECEHIVKNNNTLIRHINELTRNTINIIGLRKPDGTYQVNPGPDTLVHPHDHLFVLGKPGAIQLLMDSK